MDRWAEWTILKVKQKKDRKNSVRSSVLFTLLHGPAFCFHYSSTVFKFSSESQKCNGNIQLVSLGFLSYSELKAAPRASNISDVRTAAVAPLTSPTEGFPGGSLGRDGGRGGGGGGVGLTEDGVAGCTGEEEPEEKHLFR